jgi:hypothetical protein
MSLDPVRVEVSMNDAEDVVCESGGKRVKPFPRFMFFCPVFSDLVPSRGPASLTNRAKTRKAIQLIANLFKSTLRRSDIAFPRGRVENTLAQPQ